LLYLPVVTWIHAIMISTFYYNSRYKLRLELTWTDWENGWSRQAASRKRIQPVTIRKESRVVAFEPRCPYPLLMAFLRNVRWSWTKGGWLLGWSVKYYKFTFTLCTYIIIH
jgi:hypothetical protein